LEDPYGETYGEEFNMGPDALKTGIQDGYVNPRYVDAVKKRGHSLFKPDQNYKFLEKPIPAHLQSSADGAKYLRYTRPNTDKLIFEDGQYMYPRGQWPPMFEERVKDPKSVYAFTWRGIMRPHDRESGIAGGELIILNVRTNEVLAVRRGYVRSGKALETIGGIWWLGAQACPPRPVTAMGALLHKVLKPTKSVN
jgi:hypothetical protein